jgi:hypothetical protein
MVEEEALVTEILGVTLPRCPVPKAGIVELPHQLLLVAEAVDSVHPTARAARQKTT